jgi:hypothetical protein
MSPPARVLAKKCLPLTPIFGAKVLPKDIRLISDERARSQTGELRPYDTFTPSEVDSA